jgi:hypothetical protein
LCVGGLSGEAGPGPQDPPIRKPVVEPVTATPGVPRTSERVPVIVIDGTTGDCVVNAE